MFFVVPIIHDFQSIFFSCIFLHFGNTKISWSFREVLSCILGCFLLIAKKPKKNCILLTERCLKSDYNIIKAHTYKFIYINIVLWPITSNIIISVISIHFILDIIYSYYSIMNSPVLGLKIRITLYREHF